MGGIAIKWQALSLLNQNCHTCVLISGPGFFRSNEWSLCRRTLITTALSPSDSTDTPFAAIRASTFCIFVSPSLSAWQLPLDACKLNPTSQLSSRSVRSEHCAETEMLFDHLAVTCVLKPWEPASNQETIGSERTSK